MKKHLTLLAVVAFCSNPAFAESQQEDAAHHAHHTHHVTATQAQLPLSIMGDHVHEQGDWMVNVSSKTMRMSGLRQGTDSADIGAAHAGHMVAPLNMDMHMTMLGVMYGLTNDTTLRFMASHVTKEMDHQQRSGARFRRESSGLGDVKIGVNHRLQETANSRLIGGVALSLPTGSINQSDAAGNHLPYPMQIGSGTVDVLPTLTYTRSYDDFVAGVQATGIFRTGINDYGYRLGHVYTARAFGGYALKPNLSLTAELAYTYKENNQGQDVQTLAPTMVPTADPNQQARSEAALTLGAVYQTQGNSQLAVEVGLPVYQNLKGAQLETDWSANLVWRLSF